MLGINQPSLPPISSFLHLPAPSPLPSVIFIVYRDDISGLVLENLTKDSSSVSDSSRPHTPRSIANNEIIANVRAEDSQNSQTDTQNDFLLNKAALEGGGVNILQAEKYAAKYDFTGSSDLELDFRKEGIILVIEKADNGWWRGVHKGRVGWFPETYINPTSLGKAGLISKFETEDEEARGGVQSARKVTDEVERPRNMDEMMATGMVNKEFKKFQLI